MRINQLQYLVALEQYGSFSRAAQALYVSQPSVSVGIRELEEELGCALLLRSSKGFSFTEQGHRVLDHAKLILSEVENIRRVCGADGNLAGSVRIGSTPHYCNSILLDVRLKVERDFPQVKLLLEEHDSENVIRLVQSGALDLGLVQLSDVDQAQLTSFVEKKELSMEVLFNEALDCVVGERHPLAGRERISLEEVLLYPYATYRQAMNRLVAAQLGESSQVIHVDEIVSLRQFILRTDCFTVIPHRAVLQGNDIYQGKFVSLPVPDLDWETRVALIYPAGKLNPVNRVVRNELSFRCNEYQT